MFPVRQGTAVYQGSFSEAVCSRYDTLMLLQSHNSASVINNAKVTHIYQYFILGLAASLDTHREQHCH